MLKNDFGNRFNGVPQVGPQPELSSKLWIPKSGSEGGKVTMGPPLVMTTSLNNNQFLPFLKIVSIELL